MKKVLFIFLIILFFLNCGKKLPPPSPDIFSPKLINSIYAQNNQIQCSFNENLSNNLDSIIINDSINIENYYVSGNVLHLLYNNKTINNISLFGISDKNKNKKDFLNIKIKGHPIVDTLKPVIRNIAFFDTLIVVQFNEFINDCNFDLYPEYLEYKKDIIKNRCLIHINDTINIYAIQFIHNNTTDLQENINNNNKIKYFINDYDSSYIYSIKLDSINNESLFIYTPDTILLYKEYSHNNKIEFSHLMAGEYLIGPSRDSLKLFYAKNNN